MEEVSTF